MGFSDPTCIDCFNLLNNAVVAVIMAAKVAADLKIATAAKAAEALAKANGAKAGKIVGVFNSYFVLLFVYYISYEISITMGGSKHWLRSRCSTVIDISELNIKLSPIYWC